MEKSDILNYIERWISACSYDWPERRALIHFIEHIYSQGGDIDYGEASGSLIPGKKDAE